MDGQNEVVGRYKKRTDEEGETKKERDRKGVLPVLSWMDRIGRYRQARMSMQRQRRGRNEGMRKNIEKPCAYSVTIEDGMDRMK